MDVDPPHGPRGRPVEGYGGVAPSRSLARVGGRHRRAVAGARVITPVAGSPVVQVRRHHRGWPTIKHDRRLAPTRQEFGRIRYPTADHSGATTRAAHTPAPRWPTFTPKGSQRSTSPWLGSHGYPAGAVGRWEAKCREPACPRYLRSDARCFLASRRYREDDDEATTLARPIAHHLDLAPCNSVSRRTSARPTPRPPTPDVLGFPS